MGGEAGENSKIQHHHGIIHAYDLCLCLGFITLETQTGRVRGRENETGKRKRVKERKRETNMRETAPSDRETRFLFTIYPFLDIIYFGSENSFRWL